MIHPGSRIDEYEVEELLAEGGFGLVCRARRADGQPVALKILHAELSASPEAAARFEREVSAMAGIEHPNVVRVLGSGRTADGQPYYAMELLSGRDLETRITARGPLEPRELARVLGAVCWALGAAHARGVVHRDLKASNVFVTDAGRVVLLDFGVAKLTAGSGATLTHSRQAVGTPCAMSPEQLTGGPVDARTDVYGLGALAYHALTGQPPFGHESATIAGHLHRYARRPRPSAIAEVPAALDEVVTRAMSIDPDDRYRAPAEFAAALSEAIEGGRSETEADAVWIEVAPRGPVDAGVAAAAERELVRAAESLMQCGYEPSVRASRGLLLLRFGPSRDGADAAELGVDCDPRVELTVRHRRDRVVLAGGRPVGGPLLRPGVRREVG